MKMIKCLGVALAIFLVTVTSASAQVATDHEVWTADAYCLDEAAAELLSRMMAEQGRDGYTEVMLTNGIRCWDASILKNVITPKVRLLEKQWRIITPQGQRFDFWTAVDRKGFHGWVWFLIENGDI